MAEVKSTQFTNFDNGDAVNVRDWSGRVRVAYWSYTTPAGGLTVNDTIKLTRLPAKAKVLKGRVNFGAMGTNATADIGISGDANKYASAINVASLGQADFANTEALNAGKDTAAAEDVIATVTGANWAASREFNGYILYTID